MMGKRMATNNPSPDYVFMCAYCALVQVLDKGVFLSVAEGGMICQDCYDLERKEW